jgi:nitroimidazol reductase NimA-like FMN-containing flavoprotein (pyridoxamine 5'-phosphate oxidase superfamily)
MTETSRTSPLTALSEDECWARLRAHRVGRLVVAVGSQPDIFPVNYLVEGDEIIVRTAEGTKLAAAIMGGRVAFEIDEFDADRHVGWSVVAHGTARESHDLEDVMRDEEIDTVPWADGAKLRVIHITPDHVTGRSIGVFTTEAST